MNTKQTSLLELPDEILLEILQNLTPATLFFSVSFISKYFSNLVGAKELWNDYIEQPNISNTHTHLKPYQCFQQGLGIKKQFLILHAECVRYLKIMTILNTSDSVSHKLNLLVKAAQEDINIATLIVSEPNMLDLLIRKLEMPYVLDLIEKIINDSISLFKLFLTHYSLSYLEKLFPNIVQWMGQQHVEYYNRSKEPLSCHPEINAVFNNEKIIPRLNTLLRSCEKINKIIFLKDVQLLQILLEQRNGITIIKKIIEHSELEACAFFRKKALMEELLGLPYFQMNKNRQQILSTVQKIERLNTVESSDKQFQENLNWLIDLVIKFPNCAPQFFKTPYAFDLLNPYLHSQVTHALLKTKFNKVQRANAFCFVLNSSHTRLLEAFDHPTQFFSSQYCRN